jgi:hypothetical protein
VYRNISDISKRLLDEQQNYIKQIKDLKNQQKINHISKKLKLLNVGAVDYYYNSYHILNNTIRYDFIGESYPFDLTNLGDNIISTTNNMYFCNSDFIVKLCSLKNKLNIIKKELQKLFYIRVIESAKDIIYPIYIPYYFDFRGRLYPKSPLGFTHLKIIRPFFKLESFKDDNYILLEDSIYFKKILSLNIIINYDDYQLDMTLKDKYYLAIHLLELGKLFKSEIKVNEGITLQSFINLGIKYYCCNDFDSLKVEDFTYAVSIVENINYYKIHKIYKNITIIRDSTASFLQHWGLKLGIKSPYLSKLNLCGCE